MGIDEPQRLDERMPTLLWQGAMTNDRKCRDPYNVGKYVGQTQGVDPCMTDGARR